MSQARVGTFKQCSTFTEYKNSILLHIFFPQPVIITFNFSMQFKNVAFFFFQDSRVTPNHCFSKINVWVALFLRAGERECVCVTGWSSRTLEHSKWEQLKRSRTAYPRAHSWEECKWFFFSSADHVSDILSTLLIFINYETWEENSNFQRLQS